jgi:hypothetical protein
MKLKENQYRRIEKLLPKDFGNWHVIYMRFSRWTQKGGFDRLYAALSGEGLRNATEYGLDSTSVKVHPDAFGCLKKRQAGNGEVTRRLEIPRFTCWA